MDDLLSPVKIRRENAVMDNADDIGVGNREKAIRSDGRRA